MNASLRVDWAMPIFEFYLRFEWSCLRAWLLNWSSALASSGVSFLNPITGNLTCSGGWFLSTLRLLIGSCLRFPGHFTNPAIKWATFIVTYLFWSNCLTSAVDWTEAGFSVFIFSFVAGIGFLYSPKAILSIRRFRLRQWTVVYGRVHLILFNHLTLINSCFGASPNFNILQTPSWDRICWLCSDILVTICNLSLSNPNLRARWYRVSKAAKLRRLLLLEISLRGTFSEVFWVEYLLIRR